MTDWPWSFLQCAGCRSTVCAKCSRKLIYVSNELVVFLRGSGQRSVRPI